MAITRNYLVSFSPAERTNGGYYRVTFDIGKGETRHEVAAASLAALEQEVRKLAREYGRTCSPYIRLKAKNERKPAGFDAFCKSLNIIDAEAAS